MTELTSHSAERLGELIRLREVSPVEVAKAFLARIERLNPALNAIVTLSPRLLEKATEAEAALMRGEELGPLHGVPFTVKDTIDTAGLRTTSGSAVRANYVPNKDAPAVARLKAAGAILRLVEQKRLSNELLLKWAGHRFIPLPIVLARERDFPDTLDPIARKVISSWLRL